MVIHSYVKNLTVILTRGKNVIMVTFMTTLDQPDIRIEGEPLFPLHMLETKSSDVEEIAVSPDELLATVSQGLLNGQIVKTRVSETELFVPASVEDSEGKKSEPPFVRQLLDGAAKAYPEYHQDGTTGKKSVGGLSCSSLVTIVRVEQGNDVEAKGPFVNRSSIYEVRVSRDPAIAAEVRRHTTGELMFPNGLSGRVEVRVPKD